jgi:hypothetical protein
MSISPPIMEEITFDRPIPGALLMDAIHQVVTRHEQEFQAVSVQQTVSQGFVIGQASPMPFKELRVSPSLGDKVISTQAWYAHIFVITHSWGIVQQYVLDVEEVRREAQRNIPKFANELKEILQPSL